jgi:L-amino acid N-acyltransferase
LIIAEGAIGGRAERLDPVSQAAGFERVAHFREVGHKFGRWLDLVFMQRFLDPAGA